MSKFRKANPDNIINLFAVTLEHYKMSYEEVFPDSSVNFFFCNKQTDRNKDNFVTGFSQCTTDDDWRKTMNEEMFREIRLIQTDRLKLIMKDAKGDNQKQTDDIEELVNFRYRSPDCLSGEHHGRCDPILHRRQFFIR